MKSRSTTPLSQRLWKKSTFGNCLLFLSVVIPAIQAFGVNTPNREETAFQFLRTGEYEEAIIAYEAIIESEDKTPQSLFNLGIAYYRTQRFSSAHLAFEEAIVSKIDDIDFQAKAIFNIGNCLIRKAHLYVEQDIQQSLIYTIESIEAYANTLELNSEFEEARKNLSAAKSIAEALRSQIRESQDESKPPNDKEGETQDSRENSESDSSGDGQGSGSESSQASTDKKEFNPDQAEESNLNPSDNEMELNEAMTLLDAMVDEENRITLSQLSEEDTDPNKPNW
ncbi:MAG: tetratricopeptide repeat protein [Opitutales bacterium]|nr:tetratricopeptide repeat protein [Opitutales bacterium]